MNTTMRFAPLLLLMLIACQERRHTATAADTSQTKATTQLAGKAEPLLIPASARIDHVADLVKNPLKDSLPADPHMAKMVVLGYNIVRETKKYAGQYVTSGMVCSNCHLNAGQRDHAIPLVGVAAVFPQYQSRSDKVISLLDRIRDCFQRSLNGIGPPYDSPELKAVEAYLSWISQAERVGQDVTWRGKNKIEKDHQLPIEQLNVTTGEHLFKTKCVLCHGVDGQGVFNNGTIKPGPLWGKDSWNDGASLARVYGLAGYIRYAMPLSDPGSLSDEEAQQIAAFINSHERPAFADKRSDYPTMEIPVDAVYYPRYKKNPLMK